MLFFCPIKPYQATGTSQPVVVSTGVFPPELNLLISFTADHLKNPEGTNGKLIF